MIALDAGYQESGESWANLLRDCVRRGMRAPVLAVGDGALGEVFPATRAQRRWVHKTAEAMIGPGCDLVRAYLRVSSASAEETRARMKLPPPTLTPL